MRSSLTIGKVGVVAASLTVSCFIGCSFDAPLSPIVYRYDPVDHHQVADVVDAVDVNTTWARIRSDDHEAALSELNSAIERAAGDIASDENLLAELNLQAGIANWKLDRRADAIDHYSRALELRPDHWEAYFHRWIALEAIGDSEAAERDRACGMNLKPSVFSLRYSPDGGVI